MHLALVQVTRHLGSIASASTPAANTGATAVIKPGAPDSRCSRQKDKYLIYTSNRSRIVDDVLLERGI